MANEHDQCPGCETATTTINGLRQQVMELEFMVNEVSKRALNAELVVTKIETIFHKRTVELNEIHQLIVSIQLDRDKMIAEVESICTDLVATEEV